MTDYNISGDDSRGAIAKAIEFPDGAGFATQFHPEFEGSEAEANIVRYVAKGWQMRGRYSPKEISNCIEGRLDSMLTHLSDSAP